MRPIVYFDLKETEDKSAVVIDKKRLKEIFDEIYQAGVEDGKREPHLTYPSNIGGAAYSATPGYTSTTVPAANSNLTTEL